MAAKLVIHPAFYRRVRHYRDRIAIHDSRPQVAIKFVNAARELVLTLLQNPRRGRSACFEPADLADIFRIAVPGFPVFSLLSLGRIDVDSNYAGTYSPEFAFPIGWRRCQAARITYL